MGRLVLVRHGQARADDLDNYDQLSPRGEEQARRLARHLLQREERLERVVVGPRTRHRQTWDAMRDEARQAGVQWPDSQGSTLLDEHDGLAVFQRGMGELRADAELARLLSTGRSADVFAAFRTAMRWWTTGRLRSDTEDWPEFRARAAAAVRELSAQAGVGRSTLAITSAGLVAGAVGSLLDLSDDKVLAVNWAVFNASCTEIRYAEGWSALERFNATPHLEDELLTRV